MKKWKFRTHLDYNLVLYRNEIVWSWAYFDTTNKEQLNYYKKKLIKEAIRTLKKTV